MAVALNPNAPEFIRATSFLPYNYSPLSIFPYSSTYFQTPCFSGFHVMETPPSISLYCNANILCVGSEWLLNPLPPPSSVVPALPYVTTIEQTEVEKRVVIEEVKPRVAAKGVKGRCSLKRWSRNEGVQTHNCQGKQIWKPKRAEIEPIERDGTKTTIMIKNIPNKYTREMLLDLLDNHCKNENQKVQPATTHTGEGDFLSAFDFVYLPIDFGSRCNKGYAFVNFTDPRAAWKLNLYLHNKKWEILSSKKICEITYARLQGKDALVKHFQSSRFACETDEFLPVCFNPYRDGSGESVNQATVGRRMGPFRGT